MTSAAVPHVPAADSSAEWRRLHPLTPLLRGGRVIAIALGILADRSVRGGLEPRWVLAILAGVLPFALTYGWLSWRATRYGLVGGDLRLDTGILVHRSRRVPLARLQAVDVVRPPLARILGLAELRLEVVGQGSTEAPLAYLSEADAHALRVRLLALAAGRGETEPESAENVLVQVPTGVLVASVLLGAPAITAGVLVAAGAVAAVVEPRVLLGLAVSLVPAMAASGGVAVRRLLTEYGFTVAESEDGLRLRHGLLETRAQTIPAGRVQAVRVLEPVLWRRRGWVRVEVDVAGYGRSGRDAAKQRSATSALLPVAPIGLGSAMVGRVLGGADPARLPRVRPPRRARLLAPLSWHNLAVGLDSGHLVSTGGWLRRETAVVPWAKVQSLRLVQGPLQRRLSLATLHLDTAGGSVAAAGRHRDLADAVTLLEHGTVLARRARAASSHGALPPR